VRHFGVTYATGDGKVSVRILNGLAIGLALFVSLLVGKSEDGVRGDQTGSCDGLVGGSSVGISEGLVDTVEIGVGETADTTVGAGVLVGTGMGVG
jgi:hypothetical protein